MRHLAKNWPVRRQRRHLLGSLGQPASIDPTAVFRHHANILIGRYTRIGAHCELDGKWGLIVGDMAVIAPHVQVLVAAERRHEQALSPSNDDVVPRPVTIGRGVWIAEGAKIVAGVTIGDAAIIGLGSVVTRDVPAGAVAGGNPADIIRQMDPVRIPRLLKKERYFIRKIFESDWNRRLW